MYCIMLTTPFLLAVALTATVPAFTPEPAPAGQTACVTVGHRFVGSTPTSHTINLPDEFTAGDYRVSFHTHDFYLPGQPGPQFTTDRATTSPAGQTSERVELLGLVSGDLADGVTTAQATTTGTVTLTDPATQIEATHRPATGPDSVVLDWVCFDLIPEPTPTTTTPEPEPTTTLPPTTVPVDEHPPTTVTDYAPPTPTTTAAPTTTAPAPTTVPAAPVEELAYTGADNTHLWAALTAGLTLTIVGVAAAGPYLSTRFRRN